MKLGELKTMDSLEYRIYGCLSRLIMFGCPMNRFNGFYQKFGSMKELSSEINDLEIKDVFDMYSEKEIMNARGFGKKSMQRLKELV